MNEWRALGVCGATAGSPPHHSPPFTERPQRHQCTQAGGSSGVWLLPTQGWKLLDEVLGPRAAQARRAKRHAPRNPGTRRGVSTLPPPATAARASRQSQLQSRGAPRRPSGQQGSLSPTGLRCLVPGSTGLLGPSVTPAFLGDTRQAHRNLHRSGRGEMAPAAAPGGRGQCAYAGAESELGRRLPEEGRGRRYRAARSVPSPGRSGTPSPRLPRLMLPVVRPLLLNILGSWRPVYRFDAAKCFAAFVW